MRLMAIIRRVRNGSDLTLLAVAFFIVRRLYLALASNRGTHESRYGTAGAFFLLGEGSRARATGELTTTVDDTTSSALWSTEIESLAESHA
jgi:hypothetical protein